MLTASCKAEQGCCPTRRQQKERSPPEAGQWQRSAVEHDERALAELDGVLEHLAAVEIVVGVVLVNGEDICTGVWAVTLIHSHQSMQPRTHVVIGLRFSDGSARCCTYAILLLSR